MLLLGTVRSRAGAELPCSAAAQLPGAAYSHLHARSQGWHLRPGVAWQRFSLALRSSKHKVTCHVDCGGCLSGFGVRAGKRGLMARSGTVLRCMWPRSAAVQRSSTCSP